MKILYYPDESCCMGNYAATVGVFDGVHLGHRYLLARLKDEAGKQGLQSMVITFERLPRQTVQLGWQPELITTLSEKLRLLSEIGIDTTVVLRFDRQMAALSARDFMGNVLYRQLGVRLLLTGYDNRFGHDRTEGGEAYRLYGSEIGIRVLCGDPLTVGTAYASSSRIRQLLKDGRVEEARQCLGRSYVLHGRVVHGEQIGRKIGFPTANIEPDDNCKIIPKDGVYVVTAQMGDLPMMRGVMNIGIRPTFNGDRRTIEVNIFDEMGDFYGKDISIQFIGRLRDEQQFPSAEALAEQIGKDKTEAEKRLKIYEQEP
ncbi:MAG: bifunctional riboflavin kinase/FAD synthetase [Prevotella sp.]|nr:bifunctional riboflavin kinase/FAD synthetase [Prevotella sp.]